VKDNVSNLKKLRWLLEAALFLLISFIFALIPGAVALKFGKLLGRGLFRLLKRRRSIAIANIAASLPFLQRQADWDPANGTPTEIARQTFENLGMSLVENFKIYHGLGQRLIESVEFRGLEHYEMAKAKQRGIAFITGHCGNWELLALASGVLFQNVSVVARQQDNRYLHLVMEKIRMKFGNRIIYKSGALKAMINEFRQNHIVGVLIDQAVSPDEGYLVNFLGRQAWTIRMPALIARKTGVPLLPVFIHREGNGHVVTIYPEILPALEKGGVEGGHDDVARLTGAIEQYVVRHPTEWYWIHNRWKRAGEPVSAADWK
jgi:KDO2-lipid IV(A) lauroyltransferase